MSFQILYLPVLKCTDFHQSSCLRRPIYTGFFFKIWDQIFGTENPGPCACANCRPKRTTQEWLAVEKPDYSVLLNAQWWFATDTRSLLGGKHE